MCWRHAQRENKIITNKWGTCIRDKIPDERNHDMIRCQMNRTTSFIEWKKTYASIMWLGCIDVLKTW
jgi:hypothetical protein